MSSKLDTILTEVVTFMRERNGVDDDQVRQEPLDHTQVKGKPMWFVYPLNDTLKQNGRGDGKQERITNLLISFVMKVDDGLIKHDSAPRTEWQQLNDIYEPFHAELEVWAEGSVDRSSLKMIEERDGKQYVGWGGRDRRVGLLHLWEITYKRAIGATS